MLRVLVLAIICQSSLFNAAGTGPCHGHSSMSHRIPGPTHSRPLATADLDGLRRSSPAGRDTARSLPNFGGPTRAAGSPRPEPVVLPLLFWGAHPRIPETEFVGIGLVDCQRLSIEVTAPVSYVISAHPSADDCAFRTPHNRTWRSAVSCSRVSWRLGGKQSPGRDRQVDCRAARGSSAIGSRVSVEVLNGSEREPDRAAHHEYEFRLGQVGCAPRCVHVGSPRVPLPGVA